MSRCCCLTTTNKQCSRQTQKNSIYCWQHQKCQTNFCEQKHIPAKKTPLTLKKKHIPVKKTPLTIKIEPIPIPAKKNPLTPKNRQLIFKIADNYETENRNFENLEEIIPTNELRNPGEHYKKWIQQYPDQLHQIYALLMYEMTPQILDDLLKAGWNINKVSSYYPADQHNETPLGSASEYRHVLLVKMLLDKGANPNIIGGSTPIESAFSGHSAGSAGKDVEDIEAIIKDLLKHGAFPVVRQWFYDEFLIQYSNTENQFIQKFLKTVKKMY